MKIDIQKVTALNESKKASKQDMYDQLQSLQDEYDRENPVPTMPETLGLTKLEVVTKTDEEIETQAREELRPEVDEKIADKKASVDREISKIEEEKVANEKNSDENISTIEEEAIEDKKQAQLNAVDKGVANSSIPDSVSGEIDALKDMDVQAEIDKLTIKQETLDAEIDTYQEELDKALDNYEIRYAQEVQNHIDKLKSQLKDTNDKIIKYNNEIDKKESAYQAERAKFQEQQKQIKAEQEAYEAEHGYSGYKKDNYERRYTVALAYYDDLPKATALEELEKDSTLKQYLGLYYDRLKYYLMMKK